MLFESIIMTTKCLKVFIRKHTKENHPHLYLHELPSDGINMNENDVEKV